MRLSAHTGRSDVGCACDASPSHVCAHSHLDSEQLDVCMSDGGLVSMYMDAFDKAQRRQQRRRHPEYTYTDGYYPAIAPVLPPQPLLIAHVLIELQLSLRMQKAGRRRMASLDTPPPSTDECHSSGAPSRCGTPPAVSASVAADAALDTSSIAAAAAADSPPRLRVSKRARIDDPVSFNAASVAEAAALMLRMQNRTCSLCLDIVSGSKTLSCGHSLCCCCFVAWLDQRADHSDVNDADPSCPHCSHVHAGAISES